MLTVLNSQLTSSSLTFRQGDIRNIRLSKTFDAVVSLFHVMSYQTTNKDIMSVFNAAKAHLKKGGIFIFDCWYGPAVLTERPASRVKRLEDEMISVIRIAEPAMHPNDNLVDVNYTLFIEDKSRDKIEEIKETHTMRYLFKPEIEKMLSDSELKLVTCGEWLTGKEPGLHTWSVYFLVKAE
jgi:SAM-dependent methyltransferase